MIKNLRIENIYGENNEGVGFCNNSNYSFNSNYYITTPQRLGFEDCEFDIGIPDLPRFYTIIKADIVRRVSIVFKPDMEITEEVFVKGIEGAEVRDCYVVNNVDNVSFEGIVGRYSYKGVDEKIENCYIGQMGNGDAYGIFNRVQLISSYYHNVEGSNIDSDGQFLTETQMKQQSSFLNWDFSSVWGYKSGINHGFPILSPSGGGLLKVFDGVGWSKVKKGFKASNPDYQTNYLKTYKDGVWKTTNK